MLESSPHMSVNIKLERNKNEGSSNILRRFQRKMQESGIIQKKKSLKFDDRTKSPLLQKLSKLNKISRKAEIEKMIKLGKTPERRGRRR